MVQFSNDVRVELAPQLLSMEHLRTQLGDMVSCHAVSPSRCLMFAHKHLVMQDEAGVIVAEVLWTACQMLHTSYRFSYGRA